MAKPSTPTTRRRLSRGDWLDHGLHALADQGFTVLKADVLARSLGVSRGSFYHHFADLADFHRGVLDRWLEVTSLNLIDELEAEERDPAQKLAMMIDLASHHAGRLEQAIRAWAFSDHQVAASVAEVDRARIAYITKVLTELELSEGDANRRSLLLYLSNVGFSFLSSSLDPEQTRQVLAELVRFATGAND